MTSTAGPPGAPPRPHLPGLPGVDLDLLRAAFERAAAVVDETASDAELVDRMQRLAALRNSLEALQATTELAFARAHAARTVAAGLDPERLERSIGTQIGLAVQASPTVGRHRMRTARDLHDGLDHVRALAAAGRIGERRVVAIVGATSHLTRAERSEVDRRLAGHDIARLGVGRLRDLVRALAAEVAPERFRERCRTARSGRRVTLRQAADGMVDLTAHLPVEQGVAAYAALRAAFDRAQVRSEPLTRGRPQVMADVLVERLTGQATADAVAVEVRVVVPIEALLDDGSPLPAEVPGLGPVPPSLLTTVRGRKSLRRLLTANGVVIGGDSRARCFPEGLADLVRARDRDRCTEPYCDAPARHTDHVEPWADGGSTAFANGRGVCELHNYLRQLPGWWLEATPDGVRTTTPTGHEYVGEPFRPYSAGSVPQPSVTVIRSRSGRTSGRPAARCATSPGRSDPSASGGGSGPPPPAR